MQRKVKTGRMQSVYPSNESSLATSKKSLYKEPKFQCPECDYEATQKGNLTTHIKSIHKGDKF